MSYKDLGYNNLLEKSSSIIDTNQGINEGNVEGIIGDSSIGFEQTQMGILHTNQDMQSNNFETTSSGWQIKGSGDVEFNDGTFRGTLIAGSVHIPDEDTTANSFHVETDGDSFWGCTQSDFTSDNNNANAYILKTGVAKFQNVILNSDVVLSDLQSGSEVAIEYLTAGSITSKAITLAITAGAGDVKIQSGKTDFGDNTSGFILGIDDSDSDQVKFEIGEATKYLKYDSTNGMRVAGDITINNPGDIDQTDLTNSADAGATVGADWDSNLLNIPGTLEAPSGAGLYLSSTNLGYYDSSNWKTYMDNSGNFYLGGSSGKLQWDAGTNTLTITGNINISNPSTVRSDINVENGSTAGATWGSNLASIPDRFGDSPGTAGLYITASYLGYYNSGWKSYIDSSGNFQFGTGASDYISWNGSTLTVRGSINASDINAGTLTGRDIYSSSGNDKIQLDNGDYIRFWASGSEQCNLRGTTAGSGGLALSSGDLYLDNDKSLWIASNDGGSTDYGGIGINSSDQMYITCGENNSIYIMNNDATPAQMYAFGTGSLTIGGTSYTSIDVIPAGNASQDLGSTTKHWDDLYIEAIKGDYGELYFDQAGRLQVTNHFDPSGTGSYNLGGSARYWNDVSYKTLTDRGCLGYFDDGVELQDGSKVSDIEAIQAIKKDPNKETIYGVPMLDYKTFPKVSFIRAKDHEGNEYERDSNDNPKEINEYDRKTKKMKKVKPEDGIEMTSMFSIFIGAFKELDNRLKKLENNQ